MNINRTLDKLLFSYYQTFIFIQYYGDWIKHLKSKNVKEIKIKLNLKKITKLT